MVFRTPSAHAEFELLHHLAVFGPKNVLLIAVVHLRDPISRNPDDTALATDDWESLLGILRQQLHGGGKRDLHRRRHIRRSSRRRHLPDAINEPADFHSASSSLIRRRAEGAGYIFHTLDITETRTPEKRCEFINLALKSQSSAVNVCKEPIKGLTFFSSHFFQNVPEHDLKTYGGWMATQLKRSNLKGAAHHSEFRKQLGHLHLLLLRQPQRSGYSL
jgi:hypothetical protein